MNFSRNLF